MSQGGFWNRAGRRSGGYRPTEIRIPAVTRCVCGKTNCQARFACPCGNDLLPGVVTAHCDDCEKIIALHKAGKI
jgi:hypothetical protein